MRFLLKGVYFLDELLSLTNKQETKFQLNKLRASDREREHVSFLYQFVKT